LDSERGLILPLKNHLPVLEILVLSADGLPKLLEAFRSYLKTFRILDLVFVVAEEDEGLQSCDRIHFLVDAPEDVVEERLKSKRYTAV
jgi:hypothetical protein